MAHPLIADRAGRELIYTLSARYKNCQLLKYAMQRILNAGHDDEVGSVGSRLAGYFEVFHNLVVKRLEDMLTADDARMQILSQELLVSKPPPHPRSNPHPSTPTPPLCLYWLQLKGSLGWPAAFITTILGLSFLCPSILTAIFTCNDAR